jgi:UDPglucose 6-dehydrogenase
MPRLTVFGLGYLGTVHAACMAQAGYEVLGVDTDAGRVEALRAGQPGIHEPGLDAMLSRGLAAGRLAFTTSYREAAEFGDVHFICVGTPQRQDGSPGAELSQLENCLDTLAPLLTADSLVVGKSTVPVGTAERLAERCRPAELAWNPEFLREGHAVADTVAPDRIVAGFRSRRAEKILREVYSVQVDAGVPFVVTDLATAELVKLTANSFLATKISFINMAAQICEAVGADAQLLAQALGYDPRIGGAWLSPGLGFGGGCLPKDIRAFAQQAGELGVPEAVSLLRAVDEINIGRRRRMVDLARSSLDSALSGGSVHSGSLQGAAVGVLGLAFKPGTDDIRDSPAVAVAAELVRAGAAVSAYDPAAMDRAREQCPQIRYADSVLDAASGADVLLVLTEWPEFAKVDPEQVGAVVARRNIADGRHALDPARWTAAGWRYRALGRPDPFPSSARPSPIQRSMRTSSSSVSTGLVT